MKELVFDLETDGLLEEVTKIHSLVYIDCETGELVSCADQEGYKSIDYGISKLLEADRLWAHNLIKFDEQVLLKLKGITPNENSRDTLVISHLIYPHLAELDHEIHGRNRVFPPKYVGKHSLAAWGHRLKDFKGSYGETTDWKTWTKEMQDYCEQDTKLLKKLVDLFKSKKYSETAIVLEHKFQRIIYQQEMNGVLLDKVEADALIKSLTEQIKEDKKKLLEIVPHFTRKEVFIPKVNNKNMGYQKGVPVTRTKVLEFNPNSDQHIAKYLIEKYKWEPEKFTDKTGQAIVTTDVLSALPYPECKLIVSIKDNTKSLSKLTGSEKALLNNLKEGKIHGYVLTNGAVTGRCTHSVISNIPRDGAFRKLFIAPEGWSFIGVDAKAIELRCLAHYLYQFDNGEYAKILLEGDIHTENQKAVGLPTRDSAKTFIYAFLYGAGDEKLGLIINPAYSSSQAQRIGKKARGMILKRFPALDQLLRSVKSAAKRGYLIGIDGRHLHVRSEHKALNTLLQSLGGILMKQADIILWDLIHQHGLASSVKQMIHYHDEINVISTSQHTQLVGKLMEESITMAGEYFKLNIKFEGSSKIGRNWYDVH